MKSRKVWAMLVLAKLPKRPENYGKNSKINLNGKKKPLNKRNAMKPNIKNGLRMGVRRPSKPKRSRPRQPKKLVPEAVEVAPNPNQNQKRPQPPQVLVGELEV